MKLTHILCTGLVALSINCLSALNEKPFVIPELREWVGADGDFTLGKNTSIVVSEKDKGTLMKTAETLADDMKTMFGYAPKVKIGTPKDGDILLTLAEAPSASDTSWKNDEAYAIEIGKVLTVTAPKPIGAYWATRSLLQILEQSPEHKTLPQGLILDYPEYPLRGFMLDCARKFFTIDFLRDYVKFMSYYKMNTFQVHLNDNGFKQFFDNDWDKTYAAFRLESTTYPGLTAKDGSYSKKEFIDLQKLAEDKGVNLIPEIDAPAHSLAFAHYLPEIGSKEYGMDHLDIFNPKTYEFLDGLYKEYLSGDEPVFRSKQVHIGTDEYSNAKKEVVEKFRAFTDHYIKEVEKYGKQAVIWGALTHAKGDTPVKVDDVLMYIWHNPYAQPRDMYALGYDMVSVPDGLLYIVPAAGYYYDYLNTKHLYEKWEPRMIANETFDAGDPKIKGGMFAVWNDHVGNGISEKDVHHRVFPAMQTLSTKMWNGNAPGLMPFDQFEQKRTLLSEAPGVNVMGTVKGKTGIVLDKKSLKPGESTGMKEIGYGYKVQFDLKAEANPKGTILFQSPNAIFYLSDPKDGKLGFSRDGYLFAFDYTVPVGENVNIAIEGDNKATKLYVNGELKETLDIIKIAPNKKDEKATIAQVRTLVFPLEKVGKFKGTLKDLTVTVLK